MESIRVNVTDHMGTKKVETELANDRPVSELVGELAKELGYAPGSSWPRTHWRVEHKETGRRLGDADTLAEAKVNSGDTLRLLPEIEQREPIEETVIADGKFADLALILTVVSDDRPLALAVPRSGTINDLLEYLRFRLALINSSLSIPASCQLYVRRLDEFISGESLVEKTLHPQDVIDIREVIKIEGLD